MVCVWYLSLSKDNPIIHLDMQEIIKNCSSTTGAQTTKCKCTSQSKFLKLIAKYFQSLQIVSFQAPPKVLKRSYAYFAVGLRNDSNSVCTVGFFDTKKPEKKKCLPID